MTIKNVVILVGVVLICGTGFNAARDIFGSKEADREQETRARTKQELREMRWRAEEEEERWRVERSARLGQAEAEASRRANHERVELEKELRRRRRSNQ